MQATATSGGTSFHAFTIPGGVGGGMRPVLIQHCYLHKSFLSLCYDNFSSSSSKELYRNAKEQTDGVEGNFYYLMSGVKE